MTYPFAKAQVKLPKVALTPSMGWNSYDCYGVTVLEAEVKANVDDIVKNLKQHGW